MPEEYMASVFISYSHEDKSIAQTIAQGLAAARCYAWIDEGELRVGDSLVTEISKVLTEVDFVAALVSPASVKSAWCQKEIALAMTGEIKEQGITVMPIRIWDQPMPPALADKVYLPFDHTDPVGSVQAIVRSIESHLAPRVALPARKRPALQTSPARERPPSLAAQEPKDEPIRVMGIDRGGITMPRNDGTRGSGLYMVPFTLSRAPESEWCQLFIAHWDHPPTWTTMHRPGIGRVIGSRIELDWTTIEEVEKYHAKTLASAVEATNAEYAEHLARREAELDAVARRDARHQAALDDAVARIDFQSGP